jgi:hypothetical protein
VELGVLEELGGRSVVLDPFEGDPAGQAWQATVAAHR